jgi:hypothetical protein
LRKIGGRPNSLRRGRSSGQVRGTEVEAGETEGGVDAEAIETGVRRRTRTATRRLFRG